MSTPPNIKEVERCFNCKHFNGDHHCKLHNCFNLKRVQGVINCKCDDYEKELDK